MYEHTYEKENAYPMFWVNGNDALAPKLSLNSSVNNTDLKALFRVSFKFRVKKYL